MLHLRKEEEKKEEKERERERRKKFRGPNGGGRVHVVAKVSVRVLHPACSSTHGRALGRKEKNMDVSHPGFKYTPSAPGAT